MRLAPLERALVNNPVRRWLLRGTVEWLWRAAAVPELPRVLEVGCGQGDGVREIVRLFRPQALDALDVDAAQLARARQRLGSQPGTVVRLLAADVERIPAPDGHYDGVFALATLHHVPGWRTALREIRRVLRPGGLFLFEELSRELFFTTPVLGPLLRWLTVHPWEQMFSLAEWRQALEEAGLSVQVWRVRRVPGWVHGVARAC
ncbi:MAG: class I SAM-dependent methyltransferase [Myxococcales bacterium]|nr:class I SAM-dependent methyltransferase [Myxococcota bacterium]MDW8284378.1 class I SAM-dependent methyltransferase [Myxococcales bacterium]